MDHHGPFQAPERRQDVIYTINTDGIASPYNANPSEFAFQTINQALVVEENLISATAFLGHSNVPVEVN